MQNLEHLNAVHRKVRDQLGCHVIASQVPLDGRSFIRITAPSAQLLSAGTGRVRRQASTGVVCAVLIDGVDVQWMEVQQ